MICARRTFLNALRALDIYVGLGVTSGLQCHDNHRLRLSADIFVGLGVTSGPQCHDNHQLRLSAVVALIPLLLWRSRTRLDSYAASLDLTSKRSMLSSRAEL
jgi:hypothetical protein